MASRALRNGLIALLMLLVVSVAVIALRHILKETSWPAVRQAIDQIGRARLLVSFSLTVISYVVLTGYDVLSLRIIGRRVPYVRTALASFTSYIFSHNLGFAVLTGGTARWRIYRIAGLTLGEVAQIMLMAGVAFWLGVLLLFGIALIIHPGAFVAKALQVPYSVQAAVGGAILAALLGYLILLHLRVSRTLRLFGWSVTLPNVRVALLQFALGALDLCVATAALFVLLPGASLDLFPVVLLGYLAGLVSGLLAHAPGGVGVFEVVMLLALPQFDRTILFAALLVYRAVYFLLPLAVGLLLFLAHEFRYWGRLHATLPLERSVRAGGIVKSSRSPPSSGMPPSQNRGDVRRSKLSTFATCLEMAALVEGGQNEGGA